MDTPDPPAGDVSLPPGDTDPLDVLLIDGSPEEARRFEESLRESSVGAALRRASTLEGGLKVLGAPDKGRPDEGAPDVVVVSAGLSGSQGTGAIEAIVAAAPERPVVVLVGPKDTEVALQVRKVGVAEALRKEDLNPTLVGRTLQWALREERMQQKLRQRDAWVRSITEGLSAGVFRTGPTGRIEYANEALARMLGFEKGEDLVGHDLTEFYADPHQRGLMLVEEGTSAAELQFRQKGGEEFAGLLSAEAALKAGGAPVHYDGTITDITERKEKEKRLRVLSEAVQQAKEAVIITEAEPLGEPGPRIEYVNEAFEAMTGYAEEEILGETPRILQGPETSREVLDSVREALEAGEEWEGEATNYRKDGTPYQVQWNIAPVRKEDGEITRWVSVQRDVTDQREREKELRRQKALLEQTQRLAGAWEVDLEAGEVHRSEEARRIHEIGPEADQTLDEAFEDFVPQDRPKIKEAFRRCVEEETSYDLEVRLNTAGGNRRWVRAVGAPAEISDEKEGGKVVKVAGALQDITERKEAGRKLRKSQERLQMAVEGGSIGTWDWDLETGEVIFNRQWAEMLGYSREELDFHFSTWEELVHPVDLERALSVLDRYIAGETGTYDPEIRMRTKSGGWKWVQTIGKVIDRDENGEVTRAAGIHLDIDERKKSRRELERYREYTGRMLDAIDDLFYVLDEDGRLTRWNDSLPAVTGYSDEELGQMSALDLVPEDEMGQVAATIEEGFAEGHARMEVPLLLKDGTTVPYEVGGSLVEHPEGDHRAVVVGRDITERRRREEEIERQNDLFRRAQAIASVGAWEYEVESGRLTWTEQVHEIYGTSLEETPTLEAALAAYHPEDRPRLRDAVERAIHEKAAYDLELRLVSQDGHERWVRTRGEPVFEDGDVTSVRGTIQNITERKEQERTLVEAKREAEAANRMKSAFLATMSHEIRTPLTSILGFAEAIEEETEGLQAPAEKATAEKTPVERGDLSSLGQFAGVIQRSGKRLMKTLTGVLNLSRLEAGEMNLVSKPVDLAEQANEVAEELRPQAEEKGLRLQVQNGEEPTWAQADEGGVQIVLRNLLSNAIKYTEAGSVEVRAYEEEEEAVLEVEDTGIGMSASQVEDLFEPFRQESEGVAREYEGTGLGLAVTREAAQQMGGRVEVETQKGEGSRFTVRLPRADAR